MPWDLGEAHKPNHNSYALYYHVVFVTRKRETLISQEIEMFLEGFFDEKSEELDVRLLEQGILCDHVHLIVSLRSTRYIPEVLNSLKGTASHEANHHRAFQNPLYWMRGYHIDTVSERNLNAARHYVRDQHNHHPDKMPS